MLLISSVDSESGGKPRFEPGSFKVDGWEWRDGGGQWDECTNANSLPELGGKHLGYCLLLGRTILSDSFLLRMIKP